MTYGGVGGCDLQSWITFVVKSPLWILVHSGRVDFWSMYHTPLIEIVYIEYWKIFVLVCAVFVECCCISLEIKTEGDKLLHINSFPKDKSNPTLLLNQQY